jgi:serine/threonine protein kinase
MPPRRQRHACCCVRPTLLLLPLVALLCAAVRPACGVTTTTSSSSSDAGAGAGGAGAPGAAGGGVCGVRAPACRSLAVSADAATDAAADLAGVYALSGCARGRPVYARQPAAGAGAAAAAGLAPRVLAWSGSPDDAVSGGSGWVFAANVSAAAAAPLARANTAFLAGGFQPQAAWARPEWLAAPSAPAHAAWLTLRSGNNVSAGGVGQQTLPQWREAPALSLACADAASPDSATTPLSLSSAHGCTSAERGACPLVISASSDDPLSRLAGTYNIDACLGGRPLYTRAGGGPEMHIAFLVRAGGVWAVTASPRNASAAPVAVLLPNPAMWAPGASGARPETVAVSYNSYAHDVWAWSAWPAAGGAPSLDTSRAALPSLPSLPSPSFMVLCATSAFVTSPPPAPPRAPAPPAPPAPPPDAAAAARRAAGVAAAIGTCVGLAGAALGAAAATVLHRRRAAAAAAAAAEAKHARSVAVRVDDDDGHNEDDDFDEGADDVSESEDPSSRGGGPAPPWWDALRTRSSDVILGTRLGHGGFASVYEGTWRASPVAVKVLHRWSDAGGGVGGSAGGSGGAGSKKHASAAAAAALAREVLLLSRIRHPNVLSVYGYALRPPMLLLELGTRGNLAALLRGANASSIGWRERVRLAHGVACGLAFLHAPEPPIVHLDVKCENVVLDEGLTPKVSDFGMSALLLHIRGDSPATPPSDATTRGTSSGASGASASASGASSAASSAAAAAVSYRLRARGCGTPLYAAPELETTASGEELTLPLAVDAYCFGAAVLHALAHRGMARRVGELTTPLYRATQEDAAAGGAHPTTIADADAAADVASSSATPQQPPPAAAAHDRDAAAALQLAAAARSGKTLPWSRIQIMVARDLAGWQPELAPRVPPPLADAIRRYCAVDPAARPTMEALREEMQTLMGVADEW